MEMVGLAEFGCWTFEFLPPNWILNSSRSRIARKRLSAIIKACPLAPKILKGHRFNERRLTGTSLPNYVDVQEAIFIFDTK